MTNSIIQYLTEVPTLLRQTVDHVLLRQLEMLLLDLHLIGLKINKHRLQGRHVHFNRHPLTLLTFIFFFLWLSLIVLLIFHLNLSEKLHGLIKTELDQVVFLSQNERFGRFLNPLLYISKAQLVINLRVIFAIVVSHLAFGILSSICGTPLYLQQRLLLTIKIIHNLCKPLIKLLS